MDALRSEHREPPVPAPTSGKLPPECPLPMPAQVLYGRGASVSTRLWPSPAVVFRRAFVLGATAVATIVAAYEMYMVLEVGGLTTLEMLVLVLFVLLFAWIALSFASTVNGLLVVLLGRRNVLGIDETTPLPDLSSRTAILLPTYNEDPHRVMARFQAIYESVQQTGLGDHFVYFILSDSTDPTTWIEEEAAFLQVRKATRSGNIFYRHRAKNIARKAGNIAEWVTRFGGDYDYMIVLDADSLILGETVARLAAAMERHPRIALIQTLPILVNGRTFFARLQQFAGRIYGPLIAHGIASWYGADSNYWGHNAIIRVQAFAAHAGLPLLKGRKPFGGHILSHDFIEAALLRRAGWGIHLVPALSGSYEESPPTLTDYALRDRRWCQGNLQHIGVLPARGLHWMSRLHLMTGIGSYITAPMWLIFLLAGILISLQAQFIRPEYFPSGASLFPQWPAQDPVRAAWVFGGTMALLIAPKLLGYLSMLFRRRDRRGMGGIFSGLLSVLVETFVSALVAPIMMLMQAMAVFDILIGHDAGWQPQRRDDGSVARAEIVRHYAGHTIFGLVLAASAYAVSLPLLLWMSPVIVGLILAIPIVMLTSSTRFAAGLRRLKFLLTPEEQSPPAILLRVNELAGRERRSEEPLLALTRESELLEFHLGTLVPEARKPGDINVDLVVALAKIDDAASRQDAIEMMTAAETFAILGSHKALARLLSKSDQDAGARSLDQTPDLRGIHALGIAGPGAH